jgi:hypothetical protein
MMPIKPMRYTMNNNENEELKNEVVEESKSKIQKENKKRSKK